MWFSYGSSVLEVPVLRRKSHRAQWAHVIFAEGPLLAADCRFGAPLVKILGGHLENHRTLPESIADLASGSLQRRQKPRIVLPATTAARGMAAKQR